MTIRDRLRERKKRRYRGVRPAPVPHRILLNPQFEEPVNAELEPAFCDQSSRWVSPLGHEYEIRCCRTPAHEEEHHFLPDWYIFQGWTEEGR